MFRKLFTPEKRRCESTSSETGSSEVITKADIPEIPLKQHFFGKPLVWKDPTWKEATKSDSLSSTPRIPRSKSFSFRTLTKRDQVLCLPRSKTVQFADQIHDRAKVEESETELYGSDSSTLISASEEGKLSEETIQKVQANLGTIFSPENEQMPSESENDDIVSEPQTKTCNDETTESSFLDSYGENEEEAKENQTHIELLYPIYSQACSIVQLDPMDLAVCTLEQMKADIKAAMDDTGTNMNSTIRIMKGLKTKVNELSGQIAEVTEENVELKKRLEKKESDIDDLKELFHTSKEAQNENRKLKEDLTQKERQLEEFKQKNEALEKSIQKGKNSEEKKLTYISEKMSEDSFRASKDKALENENKELVAKIESLKVELVQMKQKAEYVNEANAKLDQYKKELRAQHDRAQDMVEKDFKMCKALKEKDEEIDSVRKENILLKENQAEQKEMSLKMEAELEAQKKKNTSLAEKLRDTQSSIEMYKQKYHHIISTEKELMKELEKYQTSNRIVVELLRKFIKSNFEALALAFQPESTQEFAQAYYEFSEIKIFTTADRGTVSLLCAFLLSSTRSLLSQCLKNEKVLEAEVENRLKYQKDVLQTFTKMTSRILHSQNLKAKAGPPGTFSDRRRTSLKYEPH